MTAAGGERRIDVGGEPRRLLEAGQGETLGVLGDVGCEPLGLPAFAGALAAGRRVVWAPLPGQPGGGEFRNLDDHADWLAATLDLLEGAGLSGCDLLGLGIGGLLAAEVAALSPATVRRLVLVAPFGLFDVDDPTADFFATRASDVAALWSARPEAYQKTVLECPDGQDPVEWLVARARQLEAAARLLWPTGDLGLAKRLHRIRCETLLVWGAEDRIVPASYARRFADGIAGPAQVQLVDDAGHRVEFDQPEALARAIQAFLD